MIIFLAVFSVFVPSVHAGVFSFVGGLLDQPGKIERISGPEFNSQNISLLQAALVTNPRDAKGGGETTIVDGNALVAEIGPFGDSFSSTPGSSDQISVYVVRPGDSLSQIAEMFSVSPNTIRWANDISAKGSIHEGQVLVILPVSGLQYKVKKGDTLASVAKEFKSDAIEVAQFNGLESGASLIAGTEIIIPNGELHIEEPKPTAGKNIASKSSGASSSVSGYFIRPVSGGTKTQGIHGYNGVDIASYYGADIYASAGGVVIVSREGGWNGGYGNYVVIRHNNGTQTLYAHLSDVIVAQGQQVVQGQVVGYMGSTGRSTGTHLHFEVRGATNPF